MRFVWVTLTDIDSSPSAKAVIVHAENADDASAKVVQDVISSISDPTEAQEIRSAMFNDYGVEWFVQELANEEIK